LRAEAKAKGKPLSRVRLVVLPEIVSYWLAPELKAATGYTKAELWIIDLADFTSVKLFADRFEQDGGRLDILVENAAITASTYVATKDGWESSFVSRCCFIQLLG
jgi:retinol dehydrogenase-12